MEPRDRVKLKADLIKYCLPVKKAVDTNLNVEQILSLAPEEIVDSILQKLIEIQKYE